MHIDSMPTGDYAGLCMDALAQMHARLAAINRRLEALLADANRDQDAENRCRPDNDCRTPETPDRGEECPQQKVPDVS